MRQVAYLQRLWVDFISLDAKRMQLDGMECIVGSECEKNVGCFEYGNRFSGSIRRGIFSTC